MRQSISKLASRLLTLSAATAVLFAATQSRAQIPAQVPVQAENGPTLEIKDFIGTINWENGGGDISINSRENSNEMDVDTSGGNLRIDGGHSKINGRDCKNSYASWSWGKKSGQTGGYKNLNDYPILDISVPADTILRIENVVLFTQGEPNIAAADVELDYCGKFSVGDVAGLMALSSRGTTNVEAGDIGELALELRGTGNVQAGNIGDTVMSLTGSGNVELDNLVSLDLSLTGSGDVEVEDIAGSLAVRSTGSGNADINSVRDSLNVDLRGSGDVDIGTVSVETADIDLSGSGDIEISEGTIQTLMVRTRGSGDAEIDAEVINAELSTSGSGDIDVKRVSGRSETRSRGSGDVTIHSQK